MTERIKLSPGARVELRELLLTGARQFNHPGRSETPYPELLGWMVSAACDGDWNEAGKLLEAIRREAGVTVNG